MHVLIYFVGEGPGPLQDELARLRSDRATRNHLLVERLGALGIPVTADELTGVAGSTVVGRPHFAALLVRKGFAESPQDAFDRYLGTGRPAYVPKARLEPGTAARLARESGAVAVLAHPFSLGLDAGALERTVGDLARDGLGGIEAYYGRYSPPQRASLVALARRHGLVPTGGSDYHGTYKPDLEVGTGTGDLDVADSVLAELEERRP